ncbi:MAG: carbon-nitrogen hydrolase family protein [Bryobacteraceae bacterium]|nr:carbon-nitrogen hydrolase family protein [Bryobacterales bacterium]MEB2362441.1 carbon-nitrogen hydrolase family protein [Bryobacterales bacterium]NUN03727.1 carbon-nitrogen hydrolase family protein [Bryobacteraceae bacterium]
MRAITALFVFFSAAVAAPPLFEQTGFQTSADGSPAGWKSWSPRPEIAPRTFVDTAHFRKRPGSLAVSGNSRVGVFGGWEYDAKGIEPGKWYRLVAHYRSEGLDYEPLQVWARLDWRTSTGRRTGQPDYGYHVTRDGEWNRITLEAPAPEKASGAAIQLFLLNAPKATLYWDDVSLTQIEKPGPRNVRVVSINHRPRQQPSSAAAVHSFLDYIEKAVGEADLIVLPEGITVVGTDLKYADVAEPLPGPTTKALGELARRKNSYIVAGLYEREDTTIYNTAVLIDRQGQLAGKYRKVYLPREETEGGITPGSDYPVFQTDFGTLGMMICWDVQYADPARALALRGAEMILLPIWGGNETLAKARAIENQVYLIASGYDHPTYIMDPDGEMLSKAAALPGVASATIDLNRRYQDRWLGNMKARLWKELRLDTAVDPPGRQ